MLRAVHALRSFSLPPSPSLPLSTLSSLSDEAVLAKMAAGDLPPHKLEAELGDCTRAVSLRRAHLEGAASASPTPRGAFSNLPLASFNHDEFYHSVFGTNCEAVVGYVPIPVGVVGPLVLDGVPFTVPMATTEGALIASTNRGARAIARSGGADTVVVGNGMTRAPLVALPSIGAVEALLAWVADATNFEAIKAAFDSTSRFGRLQTVAGTAAGRNVYLRFKCSTGDAMGMNMITKGVAEALAVIKAAHPDMEVMSLSGNFCSDKKPSAVNWLDGRGKSVSCEVTIPADVLREVLKTSTAAMVELNTSKNLVGSALAGSVGGFNAHAANNVTAVMIATGQDPAQNVESSNCITLMEAADDGALIASVTMPSVEVGTVGGGTSLPAQRAALEVLGVAGAHPEEPGKNAETLARVVAGTVLAGELSLMAALTTNDLLKAHLELNRKVDAAPAADAAPPAAAPPAPASPGFGDGGSRRTLVTSGSSTAVPCAAQSPGRSFFEPVSCDGGHRAPALPVP